MNRGTDIRVAAQGRRLSKGYERKVQTGEMLIEASMFRFIQRRPGEGGVNRPRRRLPRTNG